MLQPCKDVAPRLCTIVQCNWSRDDECSAAFFFQRSKRSKRVDSSAGRAPRAQNPGKHDPDGNHLPFESQSAQYLFSSSASKELRTAWYLSTSFTDLPVIILLHHHHQHNSSCGLCRLLPNEPLTKKRKVWVRAICSAVPLLPLPRCGAQILLHDDGMIAFQPTSMRLIRGENTPNQDEEDAMWCLRFKMWCWLWSTSVTYHYYILSVCVNPLPQSFSLPLSSSPSPSLSLSLSHTDNICRVKSYVMSKSNHYTYWEKTFLTTIGLNYLSRNLTIL